MDKKKFGITSNILKIIAIICMIIDHIGTYMTRFINENTYYLFRSIGRCAMPIFVYILVQGFFYTKDLKKYIFRVFGLATITQICLFLIGMLNQIKYPWYSISINTYLNVLYSYSFSLILLALIDRKKIFTNMNFFINILFKILILGIIISIYVIIRIEFDIRIPFMFVMLYIVEKVFINKDTNILLLKNDNCTFINKMIYITLITIIFILSLLFSKYNPGYKYSLLFSIIPILLYNGERGKNSKFIKTAFYLVFPIQHIILYLLAMIM